MTPRLTTETTRTGLVPQFDCTRDHPVWIREDRCRKTTRRSSSLAPSLAEHQGPTIVTELTMNTPSGLRKSDWRGTC